MAPVCQLVERLHQQQQGALYQRRNCAQLAARACAAQGVLLEAPVLRADARVLRRAAEMLTECGEMLAQFSSRWVGQRAWWQQRRQPPPSRASGKCRQAAGGAAKLP
jgi:hypothetical protein